MVLKRMWDNKETIAPFSAKRRQNTNLKNWNSCLGPQIAVHVA